VLLWKLVDDVAAATTTLQPLQQKVSPFASCSGVSTLWGLNHLLSALVFAAPHLFLLSFLQP
jgi:hypothetical protein